jgi:hypothetical protein
LEGNAGCILDLFPCQGSTSILVTCQRDIFIIIYLHIHRYMPLVTTVRMRTDTKALLDDLKLSPRETYDDVVRRLAESAYDDEPMTKEEIEAMEEGIADIKAGRIRSLRDVMKDLGDDDVISSGTS